MRRANLASQTYNSERALRNYADILRFGQSETQEARRAERGKGNETSRKPAAEAMASRHPVGKPTSQHDHKKRARSSSLETSEAIAATSSADAKPKQGAWRKELSAQTTEGSHLLFVSWKRQGPLDQ